MISPIEFKEKWNKEVYPLIKYDIDKVNKLSIPIESKQLLTEAGLPDSAAPFLNFESIDSGALLTLKEKYNVDKYEEYIYIGFNGNGDILAIENKTGIVVSINHETFEKVYVNKSIPQLAESLLEYADFIKTIKEINGRKAYLNRECPKEQLEVIKNKLNNIDNKSIGNNTFWAEEISLFE
ncbi:SUKH-4 family immunity protein [Clostridium estertheticum]|uniref:SUKH-4 family immunity protein n=1 Tax=Clostridium estertheticum TaxID=238834 RepID=UPI001C0E0B48|nr:SUKH-4 family immunity protein [Clostridium estertheticum]MBU3218408.1 SUKH-4 family immunity protein [Clostridium estertheticum]MBX4262276.1 SUKH-4 family immunity protein [Clostridium estertheticum]MCB2362144.1 SUKH-4 family immunity protein [Clostridium estertheticum]WAG55516.1 SUKH-4 family immunity protein [Clostridium estertheticum]WLC71999.1 SUKH-4 family immunity protein [Clostridium estertheticum]